MNQIENDPGPPSPHRIHLVGTGGQGLLLAARLLTDFHLQRGRRVLCSQLHGMAQRGGAVQTTVMIDCGSSPALRAGSADFVLGLEPVETARALPYISSATIVFMNTVPIIPYVLAQQQVRGRKEAKYPDVRQLEECIRSVTPDLFLLDATELARRAGAVMALNMVMLGCLFGTGLLSCAPEEFLETMVKNAPPKLAEINRKAFSGGVEFGSKVVLVGNR